MASGKRDTNQARAINRARERAARGLLAWGSVNNQRSIQLQRAEHRRGIVAARAALAGSRNRLRGKGPLSDDAASMFLGLQMAGQK